MLVHSKRHTPDRRGCFGRDRSVGGLSASLRIVVTALTTGLELLLVWCSICWPKNDSARRMASSSIVSDVNLTLQLTPVLVSVSTDTAEEGLAAESGHGSVHADHGPKPIAADETESDRDTVPVRLEPDG